MAADRSAPFVAIGRRPQTTGQSRRLLSQGDRIRPKFLRSYQMLVSLLISGAVTDAKIEEARKVTFQAAEQFPEGFTLVRQLAGVLTRRKVEDGINILTTAQQIKTLEPNSVTYFQIQRDLGLLYRSSGKMPLAQAAYKQVYDAVTKTDPPLFNDEQRKQVMGIPPPCLRRWEKSSSPAKSPTGLWRPSKKLLRSAAAVQRLTATTWLRSFAIPVSPRRDWTSCRSISTPSCSRVDAGPINC